MSAEAPLSHARESRPAPAVGPGPESMSRPARPTARVGDSRWFLPGALGGIALLEFLINRVAQPLLSTVGLVGTGAVLIGTVSKFTLNLGAVLGIFVVALLLLRAIAPGGTGSHPVGRVSMLMMGLLLVVLSTLLTLVPDLLSGGGMLKRAQWLLQLSAVCLAMLTVLGLMPRGEPGRIHKLGAALVMLPALFQLEIQWGVLTSSPSLQRYGLLTLLYGPLLAMAALSAGAMCLSAGRRPRPLPTAVAVAVAVVTTLAMAVLIFGWPATATRLIYMGFDLRLPLRFEAQALYLLCLAAWVYAVVALFLAGTATDGRGGQGGDPTRARSLGLFLLGLAGCQARTLPQMMLYLSGLLVTTEALLLLPRRMAQATRPPSTTDSAP